MRSRRVRRANCPNGGHRGGSTIVKGAISAVNISSKFLSFFPARDATKGKPGSTQYLALYTSYSALDTRHLIAHPATLTPRDGLDRLSDFQRLPKIVDPLGRVH